MLQYLLTGISIGCIYGIVALGFAITFQGARFFNFAHGELFMLGALLSFAFVDGGFPVVAAVPVAAVLTGLVAMASERLVFRRFVVRGAAPINTIIASIGLAAVIRGTSMAMWGPGPKNVPSIVGGESISIAGAVVQRDFVLILLVTISICALTFVVFQMTRIGVAIRATADRIHLVGLFGIDIRRVLAAIFFIAGFLGAIAGGLVAPVFKAQVTMGIPILIKGFAAAILGGLSNVWGALAGGIALGIIESFSSRYGSSQWSDVLTFSVVLIMLMIRPQGMLGKPLTEKT